MLVNVKCALLSIDFDDATFVCRKSVSNPTRSFTMESQFRGLQWYKYNIIAFHFLGTHLPAGLFWSQNQFF